MSDPIPTYETIPTWTEGLKLAVVTLVVYLVLVGCAQLLRRSRNLHFGAFYHVFAGSTAVFAGFLASHWDPSWHDELLRDLSALTILSATIPVVILLNRALWTHFTPEGKRVDAPRLLADVTGIAVFIAVALIVAQFIYEKTIPAGLLAGSGVVALVVGLALQDLLGNIVAGFAIYASKLKPFQVGDWLMVNEHHARVLEVTWRSTRLLTDDEVLLEVPNSILVRQPIINFSQPDPEHALRVTIGLHYNVPPARAQAVLIKAAASAPGVCIRPEPEAYVKQFADSSVVYEIKFWIEDHGAKSRIMSDVRAHSWYAVRRAGMEIPFPIVTLHRPLPHDAAAEARAIAGAALRHHPIFSFLSVEQVEALMHPSPVVLFAAAEPLVEQGGEGGSAFLIVRGRVEVRVAHAGATAIITQLGPGDCLGEMSGLTGEKRSATVVAIEEVEAVEITHEAFSLLIRQNPEVLNRLGDLLVQRQQANIQLASEIAGPARPPETHATVVSRLRAFFELGD